MILYVYYIMICYALLLENIIDCCCRRWPYSNIEHLQQSSFLHSLSLEPCMKAARIGIHYSVLASGLGGKKHPPSPSPCLKIDQYSGMYVKSTCEPNSIHGPIHTQESERLRTNSDHSLYTTCLLPLYLVNMVYPYRMLYMPFEHY